MPGRPIRQLGMQVKREPAPSRSEESALDLRTWWTHRDSHWDSKGRKPRRMAVCSLQHHSIGTHDPFAGVV